MVMERGSWRLFVAWGLFAVAAVLVVTKPPAELDMRLWKPLQAPLSLQTGTTTSPEFETHRTAPHRILIAADNKIPRDRLTCLLGIFREKSCDAIPEQIAVSWRVLQSGQTVTSGHSSEFKGGFFTDVAAREIGRFNAKKGDRYYLEIKVEMDGGELKDVNPRLLVETLPGEWKDEADVLTLRSRLQPIGAAVCTLLGVLIWFLSSSRLR